MQLQLQMLITVCEEKISLIFNISDRNKLFSKNNNKLVGRL